MDAVPLLTGEAEALHIGLLGSNPGSNAPGIRHTSLDNPTPGSLVNDRARTPVDTGARIS